MDEGRKVLAQLVRTFGPKNVYVELQRHGLCEQEARNQAAIALVREFHLPLLATNGVRMATEFEREILDVLTGIRHGCSLDDAGLLLQQNGKRYLRSAEQMGQLFQDLPEANRGLKPSLIDPEKDFCLANVKYRCQALHRKEIATDLPQAEMIPSQHVSDCLRHLAIGRSR